MRSRLSTQFHVKFQRLRHVVSGFFALSRAPALNARRPSPPRVVSLNPHALAARSAYMSYISPLVIESTRTSVNLSQCSSENAPRKTSQGVVPRRAFHRQRRLVRQRALPVPRLHLIIHHHTDGSFSRTTRTPRARRLDTTFQRTDRRTEPDVDDDRRARSVPSHDVPERSRGRGWTRHGDDGRSSRAMDDGTTTRDVDERRERARQRTNRTHRFGTRRRDGDDEPGVHDGGGARASDAHRGDARDGDDDDDGGDEGRSGRFEAQRPRARNDVADPRAIDLDDEKTRGKTIEVGALPALARRANLGAMGGTIR